MLMMIKCFDSTVALTTNIRAICSFPSPIRRCLPPAARGLPALPVITSGSSAASPGHPPISWPTIGCMHSRIHNQTWFILQATSVRSSSSCSCASSRRTANQVEQIGHARLRQQVRGRYIWFEEWGSPFSFHPSLFFWFMEWNRSITVSFLTS
jgi:hypothetical protein